MHADHAGPLHMHMRTNASHQMVPCTVAATGGLALIPAFQSCNGPHMHARDVTMWPGAPAAPAAAPGTCGCRSDGGWAVAQASCMRQGRRWAAAPKPTFPGTPAGGAGRVTAGIFSARSSSCLKVGRCKVGRCSCGPEAQTSPRVRRWQAPACVRDTPQ